MPETELKPHPRSAHIQGLFARIAKDYDRLNSIISLGLHHSWRRKTIKEMGALKGKHILDLCTGTGDLAILAAKKGAKVVGVDFCEEMLAIGREKIEKAGLSSSVELKACSIPPLPFGDEIFDCLTCGFGLRHLPIKKETFEELLRVLKPNGKMVILEVGRPRQRIFKGMHHLYFYHLMPYLGKIFARDSEPYQYLGESTDLYLPQKEEVLCLMEEAGFAHLKVIDLSFGAAAIYVGAKR
ncbi:bifunctional demethylmenaquinone methyltransferase/2-methoxy-6-polyprenyl-1,4-benzoquinol methylase UbiE [bacterium]|nr:bifunctional demethylmenaquinone methyltransferase/2-methoxy-6-polyprenyl-1,4-benzoquinol methylase UbiE [bacterium]MBU1613822.1 bifunctional demethylmenaquinone methyltransferase/2-methoxy-6-polyprenyl-1,4-benzoquinol methylase UbiE [bacterium]